jgi:hypothetical protein
MYKTVQITCFTKVFYVTAFEGCILFLCQELWELFHQEIRAAIASFLDETLESVQKGAVLSCACRLGLCHQILILTFSKTLVVS